MGFEVFKELPRGWGLFFDRASDFDKMYLGLSFFEVSF